MDKSKNSPSRETSLTDSTKLAIRDEVEKRVEQREGIYWKFGGLFVAVVILFFAVLWKVSISEIRETVEKQLAEKEVVKAKDRIMAINSAAEEMNRNLAVISTSMNTNQQLFMERLNQIKQQDDVVLKDDISKLFVVQTVTNLIDGNKIILDYEPIPHTIGWILQGQDVPYRITLDTFGHLEGKTIVVCSDGFSTRITKGVKVEYIKKTLR